MKREREREPSLESAERASPSLFKLSLMEKMHGGRVGQGKLE